MLHNDQGPLLFGRASKNFDKIENGFIECFHLLPVFKLQGKDAAIKEVRVRRDFPLTCSTFP